MTYKRLLDQAAQMTTEQLQAAIAKSERQGRTAQSKSQRNASKLEAEVYRRELQSRN